MTLSIPAVVIASALHVVSGQAAAKQAVPVLVELFTSEGCSSCPLADAVLARLVRDQPVPGARVIALGEHVDYWDDLGWRDSFSGSLFTDRQSDYVRKFRLSGSYTPQLVIGGRLQVLGGDESAARQAIARIASSPAGTMTLRLLEGSGTDVTVDVQASWSGGEAEVLLAVVEDHAVTKVTRGENAGRTLEHAAVVRSMSSLGRVAGVFSGRTRIDGHQVRGPARVVVFAQAPDGGSVYAAESAALVSGGGAIGVRGTMPQEGKDIAKVGAAAAEDATKAPPEK
jgi:hypothetical protein